MRTTLLFCLSSALLLASTPGPGGPVVTPGVPAPAPAPSGVPVTPGVPAPAQPANPYATAQDPLPQPAPKPIAPTDPNAPVTSIQWLTDISVARALSKNTGKPIVLFFTGSDWCSWCMKAVNEIFSTPEFAAIAGNKFIFMEVDFPMNEELPMAIVEQNEKLKDQYNVKGFPTVIIVSPAGQTLATTGYQSGGGASYANMLISQATQK